MKDLPASVRPILRRLKRRVGLGLFLEIWPRWAIGSFLIAGTVALICRMFFSGAASFLPWLWIAPVLSTIPVIFQCVRRAYRPAEIVAAYGLVPPMTLNRCEYTKPRVPFGRTSVNCSSGETEIGKEFEAVAPSASVTVS